MCAVLSKPVANSYHWYDINGNPVHQMPLANEKGSRPTNLGDARKLGLFPSVTTILQMMDKPGLDKWKEKQVALASLRVKKTKDESDEYFVQRVIEESHKKVEQAGADGSAIHDEIRDFLIHEWAEQFKANMKLAPYVKPAMDWMQKNDIRIENPETVLVNPTYGFAGTSDAPFRWKANTGIGVIDWKSKETEPGKPIDYFPEQPMQIAAYAATYWGEANLQYCWGINVYISRTEPGRIALAIYRPQMLMQEWESFKLLCAIWRHRQQWDPRIPTDKPQPVFYSGVVKEIGEHAATTDESKVGEKHVPAASSPPAQAPQQGAFDTVPPPPPLPPPGSQKTFIELMSDPACKVDLMCDGVKFLTPAGCVPLSGKFNTNYAWYWHPEKNEAKVSLVRDAAMLEHGWKNAFFAYPANLATAEAPPPPLPRESAKKKDTAPPPPPPAKAKPLTKEQSLKRLKTLEALSVGFGKHKDVALGECPNHYLDWLRGQPQILAKNPHLAEYLEREDVNKAIDRALARKANR